MQIEIREDSQSNKWVFIVGNKGARFDSEYAKDNEYMIRDIISRDGIDFFDVEEV